MVRARVRTSHGRHFCSASLVVRPSPSAHPHRLASLRTPRVPSPPFQVICQRPQAEATTDGDDAKPICGQDRRRANIRCGRGRGQERAGCERYVACHQRRASGAAARGRIRPSRALRTATKQRGGAWGGRFGSGSTGQAGLSQRCLWWRWRWSSVRALADTGRTRVRPHVVPLSSPSSGAERQGFVLSDRLPHSRWTADCLLRCVCKPSSGWTQAGPSASDGRTSTRLVPHPSQHPR